MMSSISPTYCVARGSRSGGCTPRARSSACMAAM
ncbi:Uncharacterised protein [Bordetella pertussis]|nr:Uncharacterised protein [Bordetella pertussis]